MPGSFCTVCRARIPKGSRCSSHAIRSPSNRAWHRPGAAKARQAALGLWGACVHCGTTQDLQVHHVVAARDGGPTTPQNLAVLCARCHRDVEAGQLELPTQPKEAA